MMKTNVSVIKPNRYVRILSFSALLFILMVPFFAHALKFNMPSANVDVVGSVKHVKAKSGDDFEKLARRYNMGFHELVESNPNINPWQKIPGGTTVIIPSKFILPPGARKGIVINLAELRMYHYMPEKGLVYTYPVGAGRVNWATPLANTKVIRKKKDPEWNVPKSIQRAARKRDVHLPNVVPPGPKNPLGRHAIYLGLPGYLIHGTIAPEGVGKRVSHGCIRMYPEDIEELFDYVHKGKKVRIIHQHAHAGWVNNQLFLEVHKPLKEHQKSKKATHREITKIIYEAVGNRWNIVDWDLVETTINAARGIPIQIGQI